jgi:UDP-glucose 4-epimerase
MKWLITGGAGFVGKNLIEQLLLDPKNKIRIVDNLSQQESFQYIRWPYQLIEHFDRLHWDHEHPQLYKTDILDSDAALKACEEADVIVHLAANTGVEPSIKNPRLDCNTNVIGTFNYLEAAKFHKISKFVFASSGAPLGEVEPPIHEELVPHPISPYGASKLAGEAYCSAYYHTFGVQTIALRFSNVYGPLSKHKSSVVAKIIKHLLANEPLIVYGDGQQTRDYIFVLDLVQAIISAATSKDIGGEIFQVATGIETSLLELIQLFNNLLHRYEAGNLAYELASPRIGDVKRNYAEINKIKTILHWQPRVDLQQGLERTLSWFGILTNSTMEIEA